MQKSQPHFTSEQRRELVEEHPWMRRGGLPAAINVKVRNSHRSGLTEHVRQLVVVNASRVCVQECLYCEDAAAAPIEEDLPDMEMSDLGEELGQAGQNTQSRSKESQPQPNSGSWTLMPPGNRPAVDPDNVHTQTCIYTFWLTRTVVCLTNLANTTSRFLLPLWRLWGCAVVFVHVFWSQDCCWSAFLYMPTRGRCCADDPPVALCRHMLSKWTGCNPRGCKTLTFVILFLFVFHPFYL